MKRFSSIYFHILLLFLISGCTGTRLIKNTYSPEKLKDETHPMKFIKIHLNDGGLYVLNDWEINKSSDTIMGYGEHYDYKRNLLKRKSNYPSLKTQKVDPFIVPKDKIILLETDKLYGNMGNMAAISIVGVPLSITSLYCIANPKACFGSCPTFYALRNGKWTLISEGFSSSISPSFEKNDIDMLYQADQPKDEMSIKLTNEALETHVIRYVNLLTFPELDENLVFATNEGQFYRTSGIVPPLSCETETGDCLELVKDMDGVERFCPADPRNLSKKEEIIIKFDNQTESQLGLLIGSKQTLLTTHLFYQVMAYSGKSYGNIVSEVENGNLKFRTRIQKLWDELGGIEIFIQDKNNKWQKIDEIDEMGPIASDVHLVKLPPDHSDKITLKLRLTKGLWRIDYLALAKIIGEESPLRIKPSLVLKEDTVSNESLTKLTDEINPLITMPGDKFELKYKLPDCRSQFFLETKGYYLEWMRDEWLKEENYKKAAFAFYFPGLFMKRAASGYKKAEPEMEKIFWESRYVKR